MRPFDLTWTEAPADCGKLRVVLESWRGTPCKDGEALKGTRANCATFVWAVMLELHRPNPAPEPFLFRMADVHHGPHPAALAAVGRFKETFHLEQIEGSEVRPGDILVAGPAHGGPSHLMIVGPRKNTVWHCTPQGVQMGGWILPGSLRLNGVFRRIP